MLISIQPFVRGTLTTMVDFVYFLRDFLEISNANASEFQEIFPLYYM